MRPPANCDCIIYFGNLKNPKKQFQNFGEKRFSAIFRDFPRFSAIFRGFIGFLQFFYGLWSGYATAPHNIPNSIQ